MHDCLFCKIVSGEIEPQIVLETEQVLAFKDIHPAAATHVLVIPKRHIAGMEDVVTGDAMLLGELLLVAKAAAARTGIAKTGYRLVINTGENAGQSVFHLHVHVLGGRKMAWPPG